MTALPVKAQHSDYTSNDIEKTIEDIINWKKTSLNAEGSYLLSSSLADTAGTANSDWYAFAVGRLGVEDDYFSYLTILKSYVEDKYKTDEKLDSQKSTEWHRIALTALSLGADPTSFGTDPNGESINLIDDGIFYKENLGRQGVNSYIWALITLDSKNYKEPDDAVNTRENIINSILKYQKNDGSFTMDGTSANTDITAMAVQALSNYADENKEYSFTNADASKKNSSIKKVVLNAVNWLSSQQQKNGGFALQGEESAESTAQVITALCSINIDPVNDSRFIKNGCNVLDGLMQYQTSEGGFAHTANEKANSISSEQALYALCAFYRFNGSYNSLFNLENEKNSSGIVNIFNSKNVNTKLIFNSYDLKQYNSLPENLTTKNYNTVLRLYQKLIKAENTHDYENIKNDLSAKMDRLHSIKSEIECINSEIAEHLYPFNNLLSSDKALVNSLYDRVNKLSEYDQSKILDVENLKLANEKLNSQTVTAVITVVVAVLLVILLILITIGILKKKKTALQNENQDW